MRQFLKNAVNSAPDRDGAALHVFDDHRVGANPGVRPDFNWSQDLGAGSDVNMVSNPGNSSPILRVPIVTCWKIKQFTPIWLSG